MRLQTRFTLIVAVLSAVACVASERHPRDRDASPGRAGREADAVVNLPAVIRDVLQIAKGRHVLALDDVRIEPGGRLELTAGVVVSFAKGKGLYIKGGQLVVQGTAANRVVFTSSAGKPAPGDWCGVIFDATGLSKARSQPWPGSTLEQVVVEFAGHPWVLAEGGERAAGLSILGFAGEPGHPTLTGAVALKDVEVLLCHAKGFALVATLASR